MSRRHLTGMVSVVALCPSPNNGESPSPSWNAVWRETRGELHKHRLRQLTQYKAGFCSCRAYKTALGLLVYMRCFLVTAIGPAKGEISQQNDILGAICNGNQGKDQSGLKAVYRPEIIKERMFVCLCAVYPLNFAMPGGDSEPATVIVTSIYSDLLVWEDNKETYTNKTIVTLL